MTRSPNKRVRAETFGRWGEHVAAWWLRAQFFSIIGERVKTPVGEIDIIARRGDLILLVEVKARRNKLAMGDALSSVNQHRISRAAQFYLAANPELFQKSFRFDVIFLAPWTWPTHLKGAFVAPST